MTRLARILAVVALVFAPVFLAASPAAADTDDFTITSFTADYYLDVDEGGDSEDDVIGGDCLCDQCHQICFRLTKLQVRAMYAASEVEETTDDERDSRGLASYQHRELLDKTSPNVSDASTALDAYIKAVGDSGTMNDHIVDLLTNLLHLAHAEGHSSEEILLLATHHFRQECAG